MGKEVTVTVVFQVTHSFKRMSVIYICDKLLQVVNMEQRKPTWFFSRVPTLIQNSSPMSDLQTVFSHARANIGTYAFYSAISYVLEGTILTYKRNLSTKTPQ